MSDAVLQELIVRFASDEGFASAVRAQPATLDAYDLTPEERTTLLGLGADTGAGASGLAERQSKSSLLFMGGHHVQGHVNVGHGPTTPEHAHTAGVDGDSKLWHGPAQDKWAPVHEAKLHDGGADKWSPGADKWTPAHDFKMHDAGGKIGITDGTSLGADKMSTFTEGLKIENELNGDG